MAEILHQLIGSFPIIYRVSYIPGGAGFQPSTVAFTENSIGGSESLIPLESKTLPRIVFWEFPISSLE